MKLISYRRVSTGRQVEHGQGLDVQRQEIRKWAKAEGHRIIGDYQDAGVSGSNGLANRDGLVDALDDIRTGKAQGIVAYRLDRYARDLIVQEQIIAEIRRLGGIVFTTSASEADYLTDDPSDPSRKLIRQVLGSVAEYEKSMIALRLRAGRRRKGEQGGYAYGAPPYGQKSVGGVLVDDETEQQVLARISELHAAGESLRSIAATLTEEGHQPRRGVQWHPQSLARIVARLAEAT